MRTRLQVYFDEDEFNGLEAYARERGWTKSEAVRVAVRALTRHSTEDSLLDLVGDIDGMPPDLSETLDRR